MIGALQRQLQVTLPSVCGEIEAKGEFVEVRLKMLRGKPHDRCPAATITGELARCAYASPPGVDSFGLQRSPIGSRHETSGRQQDAQE